MAMNVSLRRVTDADLAIVESWLHEPHVARWWLTTTTVEQEIADIRAAMSGEEDCEVLIVEWDGGPVGWCQWYRWWDFPAEAAEVGAHDGEIGIDYAIGERESVGTGVGTAMIAELVRHVRERSPGVGILVEPDAANLASRRILEKNGFTLVAERKLSFEAENLNAIYRLAGAG
jgi:aminoglycoside 6'-N-acetyltransferase